MPIFVNLLALDRARNHPEEDLVIIALDAEKAFDSVNLPWVLQVLRRIRLEGNVLTFLEKMYSLSIARIHTLGALSSPIPLTKGTRQEFPLSPLLFNLAIEPWARYLHDSSSMTGIKCGEGEKRLALFVGDILLFTSLPG